MLDTHCWLWMVAEPDRLRASAREVLEDPTTVRLLSAACVWEITIKHRLGKLRMELPPAEFVAGGMADTAVDPLPVTHRHALGVADLPDHHRDPFDRLLIAQSRSEDCTIATADPVFRRYEVDVFEVA